MSLHLLVRLMSLSHNHVLLLTHGKRPTGVIYDGFAIVSVKSKLNKHQMPNIRIF